MNQKNKEYIAYVAGRSAGHIVPALTHIDEQKKQKNSIHVLFFSTNTSLDRSLLEKDTRIDVYTPLSLNNVPYKKIWLWPVFIFQLLWTFIQSTYYLVRYKPIRLISMGGYVSLPVTLLARLLRIPVEIFELNAVPGKATKLMSYWATTSHLCFPNTRRFMPVRACCIESAYPLRFSEKDRVDRQEACRYLEIDPERTVVLVLGGSQGSRFINSLVTDYLVRCMSVQHCFFIHQTGAQEVEKVKRAYALSGIPALVFSYRSDIAYCYAAADLIIARAGAGTLFEILFFKKPSLIIPLETATTDHQKDNAYALQERHSHIFKVFLQKELECNPLLFLNIFSQIIHKKS